MESLCLFTPFSHLFLDLMTTKTFESSENKTNPSPEAFPKTKSSKSKIKSKKKSPASTTSTGTKKNISTPFPNKTPWKKYLFLSYSKNKKKNSSTKNLWAWKNKPSSIHPIPLPFLPIAAFLFQEVNPSKNKPILKESETSSVATTLKSTKFQTNLSLKWSRKMPKTCPKPSSLLPEDLIKEINLSGQVTYFISQPKITKNRSRES